MHDNLVPEKLLENAPELEPVVDRLLSVSHFLLHVFSLLVVGKAFWTFHVLRVFSNAAVICFNPFIWFKMADQAVSEYADVRPCSTFIWTIHPHNVTS